MLIRFLTLLIFILNFSYSIVWSQTCCSGGVPLSNNIGLPVLEKGTLQIGVSYDYNNLSTLNEGSEELNDNSRLRITHSSLVNLGYSITNNLSVEGLFTWVNQRRRIIKSNSLDQASGIGDAILLARYRLINSNNWEFSVGGGVKLPIGATDRKSDIGITLNADLQPGSNALDAIIMTSLSKQFDFRRSLTFSARLTYRSTGVNDEYQKINEYKFGNETQVFFSISDQFLLFKQILSPSLSLKYRQVLNDKINDSEINNTGGEWFFLRPSLSLEIVRNINFISSLELPIYNNVEGTQLTPTYRLNIGVSIQLFKRNEINNLLK